QNNLWTSNEGLDKYDKGMPNSKKHIIQWPDVTFAKGKLVAVGYNQGKEVSRHQIETTGKAVALRVEAETPNSWKADGMDLQYIKVWAVDGKGRRVFDATGDVTFEVSGAASLYCLDNVDHYTDLLFTSDINSKPLKSGFMLGILRSTRTAGPVTVKVSCPGMKSAQLKLMTR
ncbi:MAG: beta-galactosidase, partial [Bacteroidales bacterium]|nr:beta-galactosidase [Bacteroidales bacterium]